jgi:hypothetical protein
MAIARNRVKSELNEVALRQIPSTHHDVRVCPKRNNREQLGKMIAAVITGTNATKSKFHGSNVVLQQLYRVSTLKLLFQSNLLFCPFS